MKVYERIENLRKKYGISQGKLEKELGFSNGSISKWKNSTPTPERLKKLADFFNVSVEYLMTGKEHDSNMTKIDGNIAFKSILADIYGSCELECVSGEYADCFYFSIGNGKGRYALTETDYDRLYASAKQTIRQMTDLLIQNEKIVRFKCQKAADDVEILEYITQHDNETSLSDCKNIPDSPNELEAMLTKDSIHSNAG